MKPTLYIQLGCDACDEVVAFIRANNINCKIKDIEKHTPPVKENFGIILPALFYCENLLAYGPQDIMANLRKVAV